MTLALLGALAAGPEVQTTAQPSGGVRIDECSKPALTLALKAVAGLPTGMADLDQPRVSLVETEARRAELVAARNERVRRVVELVLTACQKEATAATQSPAPPTEPAK